MCPSEDELLTMRGIRRDPIERNPRLAMLVEMAGEEAVSELKAEGIEPCMGYCHMLWRKQKRILKEKYGIRWKTPVEMNPDVLFD